MSRHLGDAGPFDQERGRHELEAEAEERAEQAAKETSDSERTILVHLNITVPADDPRSADAVADLIFATLSSLHDGWREDGYDLCIPLAEEI